MLSSNTEKYMQESMIHQLQKKIEDKRKFVYYVAWEDLNSFGYKLKNPIKQNRRGYTIHVNLQKDVEPKDVL